MKNRKIAIICIIIASFLLTAGIVKAAGLTVDWLKVGSQGTGGVTYFNGTIINNTTGTGGTDNPVTFGDNVRIDGRVYRGATAGTGDTLSFIVNDNMEVAGNLTVSGVVTAATFQQVIGGVVSAAGEMASATTPSATTWTGTIYDVCNNAEREHTVTVIFTPTSETTGTWSSNPYHVFRAGTVCTLENKDIDGKYDWPLGTYTGSYKIVGNLLLAYDITKPEGASDFAKNVGASALIEVNGNKITFTDPSYLPQIITELTKQ